MSQYMKQALPGQLDQEALVIIDIPGGMAYFKCNRMVWNAVPKRGTKGAGDVTMMKAKRATLYSNTLRTTTGGF
jgi:hypothetical protein